MEAHHLIAQGNTLNNNNPQGCFYSNRSSVNSPRWILQNSRY